MKYGDMLDEYKGREAPEDILPLCGKDKNAEALRRICLAWQKIKHHCDPEIVMPDGTTDPWTWLWDNSAYDQEELKKISGIYRDMGYPIAILTGHKIIYPDGSISTFAGKALRQYMKKELGL